jgi:hypothetical protein
MKREEKKMDENFEIIKFPGNKETEALNFIISEYMKIGYGSLTKSDIDLIFFTAFTKYCDIEDKSDYFLSKALKVTQSRIRSLKVRSELKYPFKNKDEIIKDFLDKAQYAKKDSSGTKISIPIYDPNIFIELERIIEVNNGYVEVQLNPKIFTIRNDQFIDLILSFLYIGKDKNERKKIEAEYLRKLKETASKEESLSKKIDPQKITSLSDLKNNIFGVGTDLMLEIIGKSIPGTGYACDLVKTIKKAIF